MQTRLWKRSRRLSLSRKSRTSKYPPSVSLSSSPRNGFMSLGRRMKPLGIFGWPVSTSSSTIRSGSKVQTTSKRRLHLQRGIPRIKNCFLGLLLLHSYPRRHLHPLRFHDGAVWRRISLLRASFPLFVCPNWQSNGLKRAYGVRCYFWKRPGDATFWSRASHSCTLRRMGSFFLRT